MDFPGGPVVKNLPANAGDTGSISGLGRFHGAIKPVRHNDWRPHAAMKTQNSKNINKK